MGRKYDIPSIGEVFGNWTVIDNTSVTYKKYRSKCIQVQCSCGKKTLLPPYALYTGQLTKCSSCGSKAGAAKRSLSDCDVIDKYLSNIKYRSKKKGFDFDVDPEFLTELFYSQEEKCALTGMPLQLRQTSGDFDFSASLDRIDSSKGYTKDNVQWVHKIVNRMKSDYDQDEFIAICKSIVSKNDDLGVKVISRLKIEGIHRWLSCPIEEVSFLKDYHRHIFHIHCQKEVYHNDRDIEFIQLSHLIKSYLNDTYYSNIHRCCFFGDKSCEMIAQEIAIKFNLCECEVNEDGEGGAVIKMR